MTPSDTDPDLRSRMVSAEHTIQGNSQRIAALEAWQRQSEIGEAKRSEQWLGLQRDLIAITKSISEIQGTLRWIGRTIVGAILVAAVAFMVRGGLGPQ
ncbi:hypothetical protein HNQ66_000170 [Shinella fusca]|uniref:Uncharacterized protein n=1 Tax=Shinella fusca TaxID=544480 RepID=A0A7W7YRA6_9HYPH|nr:hypothetical protein [Shinella fusca]